MKEKSVYFVGGLPRSGSTLLMNILAQNPKHYCTSTSGIAPLLLNMRHQWKKVESLRSLPQNQSEIIQHNVMRSMLYGWFKHTDRPVCFDKFHFWTECLEMVAALLGAREKVRILITVRDLRDVIASFEKLHRKTTAMSLTHQEESHTAEFKTAKGRISIFIDDGQPVGRAFNGIRDAVTRGWLKNMHFVDFDQLTRNPQNTLDNIYRFLGEDAYVHDFTHVEQVTVEDDRVYGFKELHRIESRVEPIKPQWPDIFDRTLFEEAVWKDIEKVAQFWKEYVTSSSPKKKISRESINPIRRPYRS
ncbi:MAG: sulfotransferase [Gammaproteobacteria bacterium]|nr:sulfotransferase [Gammaproteobacteria bacterium]